MLAERLHKRVNAISVNFLTLLDPVLHYVISNNKPSMKALTWLLYEIISFPQDILKIQAERSDWMDILSTWMLFTLLSDLEEILLISNRIDNVGCISDMVQNYTVRMNILLSE